MTEYGLFGCLLFFTVLQIEIPSPPCIMDQPPRHNWNASNETDHRFCPKPRPKSGPGH